MDYYFLRDRDSGFECTKGESLFCKGLFLFSTCKEVQGFFACEGK